jgi:hypothetical protein
MSVRALLLVIGLLLGSSSCGISEPFQRLGYRVTDAEYVASRHLVAMVSAEPRALHLYDPISRSEAAVALPANPTCVGVSPDGNYAAIGHDRLISYVDLSNGTVVRTYPVSANIGDVVVPGNGRIYGLRLTGAAYPKISVLDIATGAEQVTGDGGVRARQRPGQQELYVVNSFVFPENLRSYDIRGGGALTNHLAPYHTDPICGDLWFSEDGQRLFTGCGESLRASSSRDQDMRYTGALSNAGWLQSLSHSSSAHHAIAIPRNRYDGDPLADAHLQFYHDAYLEYRGSLQLPSFVVEGQLFAAHGRHVFFDPSGEYFVVIQQADTAAALVHDFAIFTANFVPDAFSDSAGPTPPSAPAQAFPTVSHPVVDAEYGTALDRIVYVSSDPDLLHILDPETGTDEQVPLPFAPKSVSIGPAGDRAAVGHDGGRVSLIDLRAVRFLQTYAASGDVLETVLASDFVYAIPWGTGSAEMAEIALATGQRTPATRGVTGDARAKLDASGTALYVASNWLSPGYLFRFDVSQHPARYLRRALLWSATPEICGDLWMSEDGSRIFTRCGGVFRSSTDPAVDMTAEGRLAGLANVRHLSDSTRAGMIAAIPGIPDYDGFGFAVIPGGGWDGDVLGDTRVRLFDPANLSSRGALSLPAFVLGASSHPARARFVFFNRLGTRLHVIVEADRASGLVNGFGVVSFDVP